MSILANPNKWVSPEVAADYSDDLRSTDCAICGEAEVTEVAVGRGLETVIRCDGCGFEYARRNSE